ncbi:MAG: hypothetical protein HKN92_12375 [Chitinophagales bacterium]|nr:hypothetical protein [Chitinophagales bacterium]
MKLSGFSFVKNATKLYYPIRQSIESILPIVDEFVIAVGDCDADDNTLEEIRKIDSEKVKIINTVWDIEKYKHGTENAHQTDIAKQACSGDWLIYLQADEVIHEKYLPVIQNRCGALLKDTRVEGLLFKYLHFYGDYWHHLVNHGSYPKEIRIVRNDPDIHSYISAQSFRRIPNFDGKDYRQQEGTYKLKVAPIDVYIYHYGGCRPPRFFQKKRRSLDTIHKGEQWAEEVYKDQAEEFDFGPLKRTRKFNGSHPKVMESRIAAFDWKEKLNYEDSYTPNRPLFKHEKMKNRMLTFVEQNILGGKRLFAYTNWEIIDV